MARHSLQTIAIVLVLFAGCSPNHASKDEFLSLVRKTCTRVESHVSPKPVRKSKLEWMAGRPHESASIDGSTQLWTFQFADGPLDLHVIVEPGNDWRDEDPMVFVDFKQIDGT